jgi:hypothetical protein
MTVIESHWTRVHTRNPPPFTVRVDFAHGLGDVAYYALATGFVELPVMAAAARRVETLPLLHRDPFDRLLLAQAMDGPFRFFTADAFLAEYTELVTLVG